MHIVHVIHTYHPKRGGIETVVEFLAKEQAKLGHQVTVVTSNVGVAGAPRDEVSNGVNIIRVKSRKMLYNDLVVPLEEPNVGDADIVHAHSQNSLFSVIMAKKLKEKLGTRVAFQFMAIDSFRRHPNIMARLLGTNYVNRNTKKVLEIADLVLVKSLRDQEILKHEYGVNAKYLPDGLPDYYFNANETDPMEFKRRFKINQNHLFLYIGRLHKLKGPQVLVESIGLLNDKNVAAVFIGPDDGYLAYVLKLARAIGVMDRVHILGYVDEKTKIQAIDSATALVLPSISDNVEAYSIAISEALSRGKAIIASCVGEVPHRLREYENGFLVKPLDAVSLAKSMRALLDDGELTRKPRGNMRNGVKTWKEIALLAIEMYNTV